MSPPEPEPEPVIELSSKNTTWTGYGGSSVECYQVLTVDGVDHTLSTSGGSSYVPLFVLINGNIYLGYGHSITSSIRYSLSDTEYATYNSAGNYSTGNWVTPASQFFSISPFDSELFADLIDGGIEYGQ